MALMYTGNVQSGCALVFRRRMVGLLFLVACALASAQDAPVPPVPPAPPAEDARRRGMQALEDGIYSAAARFFDSYRQSVGASEPELADATALLVEALYREGRLTEAAEALDYQVKNTPGLKDAYYRDVLKYWRTAIDFERGESEPEQALSATADLLERHKRPDDVRVAALELQGRILAHTRQWEAAEKAYRAIIEEFIADPADLPHVLEAKLGLATVLSRAGRTGEALELLNQMAQESSNPVATRTQAQLRLIGVYIARNELEEALGIYDQVAAQQPKIADAEWYARVSELFNALARADAFDAALNLVPGLLALCPDDARRFQIEVAAANLQTEAGRLQDSKKKLTALRRNVDADALEALATVLVAEFRLAEALAEADNNETATEVLESIVAEEKASQDMRYKAATLMGAVLTDLQRHGDAVKVFAEAARLAETRERQASALFEAGQAAFRKAESASGEDRNNPVNYGLAANFYRNVADKFQETKFAREAWFRLGLARRRAELNREAAEAFSYFITHFTDDPQWETAAFERIRALRGIEDGGNEQAMDAVSAFIRQRPESERAAAALMEGFHAARAAGDYARANGFLAMVIDNADRYAESGLPPHALYERIHLNFLYGKPEAAIRDAKTFLQRFSLLPLAADVRLWVGDHYCNLAKEAAAGEDPGQAMQLYEPALRFYLDVEANHARSPQASRALYEAARIYQWQGNLDDAEGLLRKLLERDDPIRNNRFGAMVAILMGDVLSEGGKYENALTFYRNASRDAERLDLIIAARGRQADMMISVADLKEPDDPEYESMIEEAIKIYLELADNNEAGPLIRDVSLFKAGKGLTRLGRLDAALEKFLTVVYDFETDVHHNGPRVWDYFARSGFAAGEILLQQERYEQALRCFSRIADSGLPVAAEAQARADAVKQLMRR